MSYKARQNYKDLIDKAPHPTITRRELLKRGLATGFLSIAPSQMILGALSPKAYGATLTCPPTTMSLGAIAQIFSEGGPTMGARFIGDDQAGLMNATMAANYGITGTNLVRLGPNLNIDSTSPFGATLLQGPTGFPGGAAAWRTNVLSKLSAGGHRGPFNMDDGAGVNTGLLGGISAFKASQMSKDLRIGVRNKLANWATGLSSVSTNGGGLNSAGLARLFTVSPAPAGLVTPQSLTDASNAAVDLADALGTVLGTPTRNAASELKNSAGCAFYGNSTIADPNFGAALFNPGNIAALTSALTVASLSAAEQALLASYYQSARGIIGGVILQLGGRDYHDRDPATVIAPADIEEARALVMFLAACHAASAKGAFLYFSNGQAIASGVANVAATIGGVATTVNAPIARGDAGGSYNAGLVIFFDPISTPPTALMTGTVSDSGSVRVAAGIGSPQVAVSGLYLSALKWINNGSIPAGAAQAMGVANPSGITVI